MDEVALLLGILALFLAILWVFYFILIFKFMVATSVTLLLIARVDLADLGGCPLFPSLLHVRPSRSCVLGRRG